MAFLVLTHINPGHCIFIIEQELRQCFRKLSFTHTRCAQENKGPNGLALILQSGAGPANGIRDRLDRFILTGHTFMQFRFQVQQFRTFACDQLRYRNTCPTRYNTRNIVGSNFLFKHAAFCLLTFQLGFHLSSFILCFFNFTVTDFRHAAIIACTLCLCGFKLVVLDLFR